MLIDFGQWPPRIDDPMAVSAIHKRKWSNQRRCNGKRSQLLDRLVLFLGVGVIGKTQ
jgi:hypothetical protein